MNDPINRNTRNAIALLALFIAPPRFLCAADLAHYEPATGSSAVLEDHYPSVRTSFPWGVTGAPNLTYGTIPGYRPLTLDLYLPKPESGTSKSMRPLVIYLHGGGWFSGHSRQSGAFENWPEVLASIAARGYVVSSVNYRLSSEAPFPAALQDVKSAVRWLRSNAAEYGIDKTKVLVWGGSAGGQLAALTATSCGLAELEPVSAVPTADNSAAAESDCVQAAITWYGIFDFASLMNHQPASANPPAPGSPAPVNPALRYLGCPTSPCEQETIALASAVTQVSKNTPPMLLIHGTDDQTVPFAQSQSFHDALAAAGGQVKLVPIVGVGHSFVAKSAAETRAASLQALKESIEFMAATLGVHP